MSAWLIRDARQVVTLRGAAPRRGRQLSELGIIPGGSVLVIGDRIHAVGPTRQVENLREARRAEVFEAAGKVVMPGFVDSHTHLIFPPVRHPADTGPDSTIRALRNASPAALEFQALRWLRYCAAGGTTLIEAKSGFGLNAAAELKLLGILRKVDGRPITVVPTFLVARPLVPEYRLFPEEYADTVIGKILPEVSRRRLAEFADVDCEVPGFTLEQCRRILEAASALGCGLKVHADRFACVGAAKLAVSVRAVSTGHLNRLDENGVAHLAGSPCLVTLLPARVFYLNSAPYPPARALIDAGAAVALATGFHPLNSPSVNLQTAVFLACSQMKMTPAEALAAATLNGACALGRASETGSLEPGKFADLIVLDVSDYREIAYHFGMNLCLRTMRYGQWVAAASPEDLPA